MNAFLRYTVLRVMVFLGCLILLWLLGLRDRDDTLLLVVGAALLSMLVSFFALKRFRDDYSREVAVAVERRTAAKREQGVASDEDAEDLEADARRTPTTREDDGDFR